MIKVVVVGGGLSGMLTAYELVSAGCRVELLEQGALGRESSWAGGGILSPLYPWRYPEAVTRLSRWSQERYPDLCDRLAEATGIDPEWTRSGLLMPAVEGGERDEAILWAAQHNYDLDTLTGDALQRCEPALGEGFGHALWMASVAQVRNPRLLQALRAALQILGVTLREGCRVDGFATAGGQITGVQLADGETVGAERVVVTAGAWSARLLEATGIRLPIEPVLGQMILIKGEPGLLRHIVLHEGRYVIPRRDGRLLVGSTMEHTGFDKRTTREALADLQTAALRLVPQLRELPIEQQWAGLRPGSPDGVPFIGEHPAIGGLFLNAGHFRNGVVMGLASARLATDLLLGRDPILMAGEYALQRS